MDKTHRMQVLKAFQDLNTNFKGIKFTKLLVFLMPLYSVKINPQELE